MTDNESQNIGIEILYDCRNQLYMSMPYLNEALCALAFTPGGGVTVTAATDGRSLYFDGNYMSDAYLRSRTRANRIYLHIILHCMLRHLYKRRGKDGLLWDLACDAAVESIIDDLPHSSLSEPPKPAKQSFYGECYQEMSVLTAEAIYKMLLRKRKSEHEIAVLQKLFFADDHGIWDSESEENSKAQDDSWKNISSSAKTAMQTVMSEEANGGEKVMEQISIASADDVDYRKFLRRFASPHEIMKCDDDAFDYIYYTYGLRHFGNMPLIEPPETKEEKRIEDFVIAVDTSMSTSGELVRQFLKCTYSILMSTETFTRKVNIRVIQCDNEIRSDKVINDISELKEYMYSFSLIGGSATDFRPVFDHIDALEKEGAFSSLRGLIYFTDGMGIYPEKRPNYDAAFVFLETPPIEYKMPPWCIRLQLGISSLNRASEQAEEYWHDEVIEEMPDL